MVMFDARDHQKKKLHFEAKLSRKDAGFAMHLAQSVTAHIPNDKLADTKFVVVQKHAVESGNAADRIHLYGITRLEARLPFEKSNDREGAAKAMYFEQHCYAQSEMVS